MAFNFQSQPDFPLNFKGALPGQLGGYYKWGILIVAIIALFVIAVLARSIYTDWLWFGGLGFRSVFIKILITRVMMFVVGAVGFGIISGISLYFANKISQGHEEIPLPPQIRDVLKRLIFWGTVVGAGILSIIFGVIAAGHWEIFLRFSSASDFGVLDPLYSRDVAFYVFDMPMYEFLQGWLLGAVVVTMLATLGIYFVNFSYRGVGIQLTHGLKVQVSILAFLAMMIFGAGLWLDRWALVLSDQGAVFGASYTDVHARRNALLILTVVAAA